MKIVWSETALETCFKVIDYLFEHWSTKEIEVFESNVDALIERIASFNQMCPESKLFGFRKCIIDENNSLVYKVARDTLYIVTFLDNRSQHSF